MALCVTLRYLLRYLKYLRKVNWFKYWYVPTSVFPLSHVKPSPIVDKIIRFLFISSVIQLAYFSSDMLLRCYKTPDIRTGLAPFLFYRCDPWEPLHSQIAQLCYIGDQQPWAEGSVMKNKRNTVLETSALNFWMLQWLRKSVSGIEKDSRQCFERNDFVSYS